MSEYTWVPAFKAIADWLSGYEDRQPELIQILRDIGVDKGLDDKLPDDSRAPLSEIDPFSFFAVLMKYGPDKRRILVSNLLQHANIEVTPPLEFDGVPSAQPLKVWLFPYARVRTNDMIPKLWKLFRQARELGIDGELFDAALDIPGTGFAKLTECLFYVAPEHYFPVDKQTHPWLAARGAEPGSGNWDSYRSLLAWLKNNVHEPYYQISHQAWLQNQSAQFSAKAADEYLTERYEGTRSETIHIIAYKTDSGRELAFDPGKNPEKKKAVKVFLDAPPPESLDCEVKRYSRDQGRNEHLKQHAPSLAKGNEAWTATIKSQDQLTNLCDWYEGNDKELPVMDSKETTMTTPEFPLNQILYGPPGTGKTYSTIENAVAIADPDWHQNPENTQQSTLEARYKELVRQGRIRFTTFHQSFSYEDFIEGIRASTDDDGQVIYSVEDGVFKEIANEASRATAVVASGLSATPKVWKISIGRTHEKSMRDRYIANGEARIGWNKVGDLSIPYEERSEEEQQYMDSLKSKSQTIISYFAEGISKGDVLLCLKDAQTIQAIGIVESDYYYDPSVLESGEHGFAHARKVKWLLKDIELDILPLNDNHRLVQQTIYHLDRISWDDIISELQHQGYALPKLPDTSDNASSKPNYVLIIDEINRGNISRIFGELITLLEPNKRKGQPEEKNAILPYSKKPFTLPDNLYLIGTMNTADRSLAQIDLALRRRFEFIELLPNPSLLSGVSVYGIPIDELLDTMNQRIEVLIDRDHTIGHAYFWPIKEADSEQVRQNLLAQIFEKRILPLLQEYFFSDWERIGWVLNDPAKTEVTRFIQTDNLGKSTSQLFGSAISAEQISDRRYRINRAAFTNPVAYRGILSAQVKDDQ